MDTDQKAYLATLRETEKESTNILDIDVMSI